MHGWGHGVEDLVADERRREVLGESLGRNHMLRANDGLLACHHGLPRHVPESVASSRGETIAGKRN